MPKDLFIGRCSDDLREKGLVAPKICIACGFGPCAHKSVVTQFPVKIKEEPILDAFTAALEKVRDDLTLDDYVELLEGMVSKSRRAFLEPELMEICEALLTMR